MVQSVPAGTGRWLRSDKNEFLSRVQCAEPYPPVFTTRKLPENYVYCSGIERGVRNVSLINIEKIAKGLKIVLPKLFERV